MSKTDITGRKIVIDPAVIIRDMEKAAKFFGEMLNTNLTIDLYPDENRFEVVDAGVDVMIDSLAQGHTEGESFTTDPQILISTVTVTPGCMYMSNGDPGYPPETDYNDEGVFDLDKKNDAIERMISLIAINLFRQKGDAEAEKAMYDQMEEDHQLAEDYFAKQ